MNNTSVISYVLLSIVIGYVFILPAFTEVPALNEQKQRYLSALDTVSSIESQTSQLRSQFENMPIDSRERINTILPDSFNFVRTISQIDNVATRYGISIDSISSGGSPSSGNSVAEAEQAGPYNSAVIKFSFVTSYPSFKSFMDELEKSLRILDVKSVDLEEGEDGLHTFDVEFETYWLKE